jgi:hypothetical protein
VCREERRGEERDRGLLPIYSIGSKLAAELPEPIMGQEVILSHI